MLLFPSFFALRVFPIIQHALRLSCLIPIPGMEHRLFLGVGRAGSLSWVRGDLVGQGKAQDLPFLSDSKLPVGRGPLSQKMERGKCEVVPSGWVLPG